MSQFTESFLNFEKESDLFLIKNDKNIYLWDIFRYYVGSNLESKINYDSINCKISNSKKNILTFFKYVSIFIKSVWFIFFSKKQYDNLFFIASRNKKNGMFFDQVAIDTYNYLKNENNLILETTLNKDLSLYFNEIYYYSFLFSSFSKIYKTNLTVVDKNCIKEICCIINSEYPQRNLKENELEKLLLNFYKECYLFKKIYKNHDIKRIFLTQNGIQKAQFYVAKEMKIPIFEFQHGIIGVDHLAYSYPKINNINKYIYITNKFLTLSDYWCTKFFYPGIRKTVGNNFFSKNVVKHVYADKILVISADVFGKELAKIIKESMQKEVLLPENIIFKLHPNQYSEKDFFDTYFDGKVRILTNESSVNELLADSLCMITVCSTAVYEALQSKTRCLIYKFDMYKQLELLFDDENLFLFDTVEELRKGLMRQIPEDYIPPLFFDSCNSEKIREAISEK